MSVDIRQLDRYMVFVPCCEVQQQICIQQTQCT
jgi:hypothetical protein